MLINKIENLLSKYKKIYIYTADVPILITNLVEHRLDNDDSEILQEDAEIMKLIYTYQFSDKVQLITRNVNYPTIFNYYETGILTEDELIEALLK